MDRGVSRGLLLQVLALIAFGFTVGCKSTPPAEAPVTQAPTFQTPKQAERVDEPSGFKEAQPRDEGLVEETTTDAATLNAQKVLKRVHFDYDKYDLTADAIRILGQNAARIKEHSDFKVRIEGHCDERGTLEYNLALGEKRARATRDYLVSLGVPSRRLSIVSYGKERPLDSRHNQTAWAMNRRGDFMFRQR